MKLPAGPIAVYGLPPRNRTHAPAHDWTMSAPHWGYSYSRAKTYPATTRPMTSAATMRTRRDGGEMAASPAPACESEPAAGDAGRLAASELAITASCGASVGGASDWILASRIRASIYVHRVGASRAHSRASAAVSPAPERAPGASHRRQTLWPWE